MSLLAFDRRPIAPPPPAFDVDIWAAEQAAMALAREVAQEIGAPVHAVWQSLVSVPENMLSLLDSPQGWTALAGFVAHDLGLCAPDYRPGVH